MSLSTNSIICVFSAFFLQIKFSHYVSYIPAYFCAWTFVTGWQKHCDFLLFVCSLFHSPINILSFIWDMVKSYGINSIISKFASKLFWWYQRNWINEISTLADGNTGTVWALRVVPSSCGWFSPQSLGLFHHTSAQSNTQWGL